MFGSEPHVTNHYRGVDGLAFIVVLFFIISSSCGYWGVRGFATFSLMTSPSGNIIATPAPYRRRARFRRYLCSSFLRIAKTLFIDSGFLRINPKMPHICASPKNNLLGLFNRLSRQKRRVGSAVPIIPLLFGLVGAQSKLFLLGSSYSIMSFAVLKRGTPRSKTKTTPIKYSCDGKEVNPPLTIEVFQPRPKRLLQSSTTSHAPRGTFDHWVVWNISLTDKIDENVIPGTQGVNSAWTARLYWYVSAIGNS